MNLADLLGSLTPQEFVKQYFLRLPYATAGSCQSVSEFGWVDVETIWASKGVDGMVVRRGERLDGDKLPSFVDARRKFADGFTLAIRSAEKHSPLLQEFADAFERSFRAPINVHVYCTPGGEHGFSWHYDAEEVFILQASGSKKYSLRKNTVQPWPLVETMGPDLGYQHEIMPVIECRLEAGDLLYIPCGYWHRGESAEDSISIAVGVMAPAGIDLYDALRERLIQSILWRQRLPIAGEASSSSLVDTIGAYRDLVVRLSSSLATELADPSFIPSYLKNRGCAQADGGTGGARRAN